MQLEHSFTVPVPVDRAWDVLNDVEMLAPCMPGAVLDEVRGNECDGRVKVKLGPIQVTYSGTATFLEVDKDARRLVVKAAGKETRGSGTANATITAVLTDGGDSTTVNVTTDLAITGKPAQFARGVMVDVSNKLLGQFVDCLSAKISAPADEPSDAELSVGPVSASTETPSGPGAANGQSPAATKVATPRAAQAEPEAIDLLGTAGSPVLKRVAPVVLVVLVLLYLLRRHRG